MQGPQGVQGPSGGFDRNKVTFRVTPDIAIPAGSLTGNLSAFCAAGELAISGGYFTNTGFAYDDRPSGDGTGWVVLIDNFDSSLSGHGNGYVVCARA